MLRASADVDRKQDCAERHQQNRTNAAESAHARRYCTRDVAQIQTPVQTPFLLETRSRPVVARCDLTANASPARTLLCRSSRSRRSSFLAPISSKMIPCVMFDEVDLALR